MNVTLPATDARTRILDAVERIVLARGVAGLTLEAAAREAGVSKGGLLYHFASKEALLTGLLERLAAFIRAEFDKNCARQPDGPGRVARAFLSWAFGEADCSPGDEHHDRAAAVFLAAFHHDPALLDPMRAVYGGMKAALMADGVPPGKAMTVLAACDGMFMAQMFGLYRPTEDELSALRATLETLLEVKP
ncbi:TetR/AcrR family transcriptional regulator [Roseomonas fluvialis]|uniref:TetR family transcriptional regulator n=1 Tax=Roseomonas fluvialis TaxID=1750527 RepID=A0ABN6PBC4_9PROT|nr:TetR/AcrR family transcriptional regulator [Roseomonas fluvialis]BDG74795.1 TetR family transcriptional regulator [Roseomonas fluvialis]